MTIWDVCLSYNYWIIRTREKEVDNSFIYTKNNRLQSILFFYKVERSVLTCFLSGSHSGLYFITLAGQSHTWTIHKHISNIIRSRVSKCWLVCQRNPPKLFVIYNKLWSVHMQLWSKIFKMCTFLPKTIISS